ncbi:MAG: hypothetical protein RL114_691 [Actinomycetota bacterium]|jgi:hypothetical protein
MRKRKKAGPVESLGDGAFRINLSEDERETMLRFVDQLEEVLTAEHTDPRLRRLFPTAYHEDPDLDAEYQGYMRDELSQSRASSIATVREILGSENPIAESQLYAFMMVLNSLRLVLGTLLGVSEDEDTDDIEEDDPSFGQAQLYGYLGWLLEWTVDTLSNG